MLERDPASTNPRPLPPPEGLVEVINAIADRVDPLLRILTTAAERSLEAKKAEARHHVRMSWVAFAVVFLIVAVSAWLTFVGRIDGSTFTFLLGLIVGYVLTFVRDQIAPPSE
jgi:lipopolysaccharide export LptBFGC system permease protein LptF